MSESTPRGFRIFDKFTARYNAAIIVFESSAALRGPCCFIQFGNDMLHLDLAAAERLRDALDAFSRAARNNELTEPMSNIPEEAP